MNSSPKNKILVWAVTLLIIANVAVLETIWLMHHHTESMHKMRPEDFLVHQLDLNDEQKKELHELAEQHHQQAEKIKADIKNARDSFFILLKQVNISDSTKKSVAANVAKNLEELEMLTFDHFQQVRKICNPDQQKKFDEILQQVLQVLASAPSPGGHGEHNLPLPDGGDPAPPDK